MGVASALFRLADNGDAASVASRFRANRFRLFANLLQGLAPNLRILDVGGTPQMWIQHRQYLPSGTSIVLLNADPLDSVPIEGISPVRGDARDLSNFATNEFDVCFSNSLIEHFETFAEQEQVANEIRRVARGYFVQTPNRYFPMEPHFLVPGWQFAPVQLRAFLIQKRSFGWVPRATTVQEAWATVNSIHLLGAREMRQLFPDALLTREKFGPFTKSLIAIRQPS